MTGSQTKVTIEKGRANPIKKNMQIAIRKSVVKVAPSLIGIPEENPEMEQRESRRTQKAVQWHWKKKRRQ